MAQKVAYVTGGMGGIGTAICQRLHKEGPIQPYILLCLCNVLEKTSVLKKKIFII